MNYIDLKDKSEKELNEMLKEKKLLLFKLRAKLKTMQLNNPNEIKEMYRSASIVGDSKVVFNIAGNKYRLIVTINYYAKIVFIKFIGTHKQYDKINIEEL